MFQELNKEILIYLNSLTEYNFIQKFILIFADTPIFFLPIFLLWMWIYYTYKKSPNNLLKLEKEKLLFIFYSTIIWIFISIIIQQLVIIERPEEALKWVWLLLLNHIPDASFPSDHATVSVAFLTSLFLAWYKKTWLFFSFFVLSMLLSRIIVWVHWPFDIIVWSLVWIIASYITFKYLSKLDFIKKINKSIINILWYIKL